MADEEIDTEFVRDALMDEIDANERHAFEIMEVAQRLLWSAVNSTIGGRPLTEEEWNTAVRRSAELARGEWKDS
jgi:hypothetical protein